MVRKYRRPFPGAAGMLLIPAAVLLLMAGCGKTAEVVSDTTDSMQSSAAEENAVLYLDGYAVSPDEYEMLAQEYCNQIYMKYSTEQVNSEDFWETEEDGTAPAAQLAEIIEEKLRYNYALKSLAVDLGVTEDYTYADLLSSMDAANSERAESDASDGEITYGLTSYDASSWYASWYSNLETDVVNALIEDEVSVSDADCRAYYEENEESYTYEVGVTLLYAEVSCDSEEGETEGDAFLTARGLAAAMETVEDAEQLEEAFPGISIGQLELTSLNTEEGISGVYSHRWELASSLTEGEIYGPYQDNGLYCVMKCISRIENGVADYDSVEAQIESYLKTQEAQEIIDSKAEELSAGEGNITVLEAILDAVK